jgi:aminomethyltransferase
MSEIEVSGPDATALMNRLTTNDVTALEPGDAQYAGITTDDGILLDDTVVYRLPDGTEAGSASAVLSDLDDGLCEPSGDPAYFFVPNAGHDDEMLDRWVDHRGADDFDATIKNTTDAWAMVAVQGPAAADAMEQAITDEGAAVSVDSLSPFQATVAPVADVPSWVARTGYTGEDGFEVVCPAAEVEAVWNAFDAQPCGLGARDTLRMEMGFLLSGQDFDPDDEPRTPYEAGIGFVVDLDTPFVGRDALAAARADGDGPTETFTGIRLRDRGVPRAGYAVTDGDGTRIGTLTSGTMSPTLGEPIGLGYVEATHAEPGTDVAVVVRGDQKAAVVTAPPFLGR